MKSDFYVPPPAVPSLAIEGDARRMPVRRIYCVGRNYAEHVREMGGDERELPFFFQKPADALVEDGVGVPYPSLTADFQHEVELVLVIGREGSDIPVSAAAQHVCALGVGVDLTRRDVQVDARKTGRPWEIGKSFDHSAPCSMLKLSHGESLPTSGRIELFVNGDVRQGGGLDQMIWSAAEVVSKLSEQYRLFPGDLIYTGTPAGVGPVRPGDRVEARVENVGALRFEILPGAGLAD